MDRVMFELMALGEEMKNNCDLPIRPPYRFSLFTPNNGRSGRAMLTTHYADSHSAPPPPLVTRRLQFSTFHPHFAMFDKHITDLVDHVAPSNRNIRIRTASVSPCTFGIVIAVIASPLLKPVKPSD